MHRAVEIDAAREAEHHVNVVRHDCERMQRIAFIVEVPQRTLHQVRCLWFRQMARTESLVSEVIESNVEHAVDGSTLDTTGRLGDQTFTFLHEIRKDLAWNRIVEANGDRVERVVELPVRQTTSRTDAERRFVRDEVVVSRHGWPSDEARVRGECTSV